MTAPPYTDDRHIVNGKCYASYVRSISDRDGDPDPYPDIDLLSGTVKFESVYDGAGARPALPLPALPRTKGIVISGDTYEVKNSNLIDKEGREGVWLVLSVDGIPLTWRATVTLTDERNRVLLNAAYIVTEDVWEVELDGRHVINLPDLIPNPGALTPVEGAALRAAQQTLDEISVLKGLIDTSKMEIDNSKSSALAYRNQAQGFRNEAEGFKNAASEQADIATTKAGEATTSASNAASSAGAASGSAAAAEQNRDEVRWIRDNHVFPARDEAVAAKVEWRGPWSASTAYTTRDAVSHNGSSWWAVRPSTGVTPVEGADWSLLAAKGERGDGSSWSGITDKPTTFPPAAHQHTTADVTGLVTALASKADLDSNGKLPAGQLPALAVVEFLGSVASQAAMLALAGQKGDWCIRTDTSTTWIITGDNPAQVSSWTQLATPASGVSSVAGRTGAVTLSKADVGLSNVDNTSDANKPISTAVSTALAGKADTNHSHTAEFARVAAAPATWYWIGTSLPTSASQVHAQARVGDMIVAPNLTASPGWHRITGV